MSIRMKIIFLGVLIGCLIGCQQRSSEIVGGTPGTLKFGNEALADLAVVLHRVNGSSVEQVGFGRTNGAGEFQLVVQGREEPLQLPPGDYVATLESLGPPIVFPKEYCIAEKSVLKVQWTGSSERLNLEAPEKLLAPLKSM
ncbi:MAG: hypothetical protein JNM43_07075 [Planctomycetaceae bacterium]|nr:hypothetical protein [Planctomycetaceae bacterium]